MKTIPSLFLLIWLASQSICYADVKTRIVAEPESEASQRIIGTMTLEGNKLSFSKIKGYLEIVEKPDIQPPAGFQADGALKVYELKNAAAFLKNKRADFFCPKPAQFMLIETLSENALRVYFLQADLATFQTRPDISICSAATYDLQ